MSFAQILLSDCWLGCTHMHDHDSLSVTCLHKQQGIFKLLLLGCTSTAGSTGSNSASGASPSSPGSHYAYSPTAAAAAAATAVLHGHSVYSMSQSGMASHSMCSGGYYHQDGLPGWQQGFFQGVGYGQPMRAYR